MAGIRRLRPFSGRYGTFSGASYLVKPLHVFSIWSAYNVSRVDAHFYPSPIKVDMATGPLAASAKAVVILGAGSQGRRLAFMIRWFLAHFTTVSNHGQAGRAYIYEVLNSGLAGGDR